MRKFVSLKDLPDIPSGTLFIQESTGENYHNVGFVGLVFSLIPRMVEANPDWFAEIKDEKSKVPTYDDVVKELKPQWMFYCSAASFGILTNAIKSSDPLYYCSYSERQAKRIALRIKWENIAKYVNDKFAKDKYGWCWIKCMDCCKDLFKTASVPMDWHIVSHEVMFDGITYFNSQEAAELAMQIMGIEDFKKMNLCTQ